jgi:hypothetical protein
LLFANTAQAQETQVSGTVSSITGEKLPGVTVQVRGTDTRTTTDANGRYSLTVPSDGVLLFGLIGYKGAARTIAGREAINVVLDAAVAVLDPVVVTGYTSQRRADITGAVSSVGNMEGAAQQTGASVLQRLDGRVPGVQVENSVARCAHHRAHPRRQLVSEQRSAHHRGRHARSGHLPQLAESERNRIDPGPERRVRRVHLRLAGE